MTRSALTDRAEIIGQMAADIIALRKTRDTILMADFLALEWTREQVRSFNVAAQCEADEIERRKK